MYVGLPVVGLLVVGCAMSVRLERSDRASVGRAVAGAWSAYFSSHVLLVVAGLISMPIMTRLLSKDDYGLLGLSFLTVSVLTGIGGLGFGESAVRLFGEHKASGAAAMQYLCDSLIGGALAMGALTGAGLALCARTIAGASSPEYERCLLLGSLLVVVRPVSGVLYQIYRAQERAVAHATTQVSVRFATTVVAIVLLLLYARAAFAVIVASVLVEGAAVVIRLVDLRRRQIITRPRLAPALLATAASYGVPLAVAGAARFLLDYGDRFVVERWLGLGAVATYGVAYDIAERLTDSLLAPAQLAVVPVLFRLWAQGGQEATAQVASRVLTYMIALTLPVALLYWALSDDLIVLVASTRYNESSPLTPYLLPGVIFGNLNFITVVGLTIQKRTVALAVNVGAVALLNVALNLLLVPRLGLMGGAIATTLSYATLLVVNYAQSRSIVRLHVEGVAVVRALLVSAAMLLAVSVVGGSHWPLVVRIVVRGGVGAIVAMGGFWLLDSELRGWIRARFGAAVDARAE